MKTITNSNIKYYLIPLVFILTVFFIIPYELYYNAQEYWEWKNKIPFQFNLVGIFLYLIIIICLRTLFLFFNNRYAKILSLILLFAGLFILLADVFAPLQTNLATGETLVSTEPVFYTIIEFFFFVILLIYFLKCPMDSLAKKGFILFVFLTALSTIYFGLVLFSKKPEVISGSTAQKTSKITGNVYHILLDEMQTDAAQLYFDEDNNSSKYNGFILYPNNLANYLSTHASFPSYITSRFFEGGSFETWYKTVYKDKGLFKALHEKGYQIRQYAYSNNWRVPFTDEFHTLTDIYEEVTRIKNREYQDFIQILIARSMPNLFANEALDTGKKIGSFIYDHIISESKKKMSNIPIAYEDGIEPFSTVLAFKHMIKTEEQRPANGQYIYFHSVLPHPPYVYDENGTYNLEYRDSGTKGYYGQVKYAFKLVEEFMTELKRLGRYHDSTIIIHADTGHSKEGFLYKKNNIVQGTLEQDKISQTLPRMGEFFSDDEDVPKRFYNFFKDHILSRTNALLMIKTSQHSGKMQKSALETQLIDVYPSLSALLDLPSINDEDVEGLSVFSDHFPEKRDASFFWFPYKELEPEIIKLNISDYSDRKNAIVSFGGKLDQKTMIDFPKEGFSINVGVKNEGRLKLINFGPKGTMDKDNKPYRWALGKHGQIIFPGTRVKSPTKMVFGFSLKPFIVNEMAEMKLSTSLSSASVFLKPSLTQYQVPLTFQTDKDLIIDIDYKDSKSPKSLGMGTDERDLSALWTRISLHPQEKVDEMRGFQTLKKLLSQKTIFYDIGAPDEKELLLYGFGAKNQNSNGSWRWAVGRKNIIVLSGIYVEKKTRISFGFKVMPSSGNETKKIILKTSVSQASILLKPGLNHYKAILTLPNGQNPEILITHPEAKSPFEMGSGKDTRQLASLWTEISISKVKTEE